MVNCPAMNASTQRADEPHLPPGDAPLNVTGDENARFEPAFDSVEWAETRAERDDAAAGGRAVLGCALTLLAALWIGYTAWSAGRALAEQPLGSPAIRAMGGDRRRAAGPARPRLDHVRAHPAQGGRALHPLGRRDAHRSALARGIARRLAQRIDESHAALGSMAKQLMELGRRSHRPARRGDARIRRRERPCCRSMATRSTAPPSWRGSISACCSTICRAPKRARGRWPKHCAAPARSAVSQAAAFEAQVDGADRAHARSRRDRSARASQRLVAHLTQIESAGAAAAARVRRGRARLRAPRSTRCSTARPQALDEIRGGIDIQAAAVAALVEQASAGIGRAGVEAAGELGSRLGRRGHFARHADRARRRAGARVAADDRRHRSRPGALDERFAELASDGDARAAAMIGALARTRGELDALAQQSGSSDGAVEALAERTAALRAGHRALVGRSARRPGRCSGEAESGAGRLLAAAEAAQARDRLDARGGDRGERTDRGERARHRCPAGPVRGLLATSTTASAAPSEACRTDRGDRHRRGRSGAPERRDRPGAGRGAGPGARSRGHAAERAREAISAVIPESAGSLSARDPRCAGAGHPRGHRGPAARGRAGRGARGRGGARRRRTG